MGPTNPNNKQHNVHSITFGGAINDSSNEWALTRLVGDTVMLAGDAVEIGTLYSISASESFNITFEDEGNAFTGDLPISADYNYTIHVKSGIITGWS